MLKSTRREYDLLELLQKFISANRRGKRLQKSGKRLTSGTVENYTYLYKLLSHFSSEKQFPLRIRTVSRLNKKELKTEQNYWEKFYRKFTDYLYDDLDHYDNYVGMQAKHLRSFMNWLNTRMALNVGDFHQVFYTRGEEIQIVVLSPERLNHLIHARELEQKIPQRLVKVKDIFVFGCTVALRFSDLMNLKPTNLEKINNTWYLNVQSKKTQTYTRVKLPGYAVSILEKYKTKARLLPYYHKVYLNRYIKELLEVVGWTEPFARTREKRGIPVTIYKDPKKKEHYRFCDMITTHTMRRTAITTMLSLGMNEQAVRKISGHAANSKEFYRYVSFAQAYLDTQIDSVHEKLNQKDFA
ncbi:MAG TPA: tyrosine-type recombinase/integrase [Bacteroidia bacterium]|jgi:integrase|nr:tyrosine-type recombinase/integrase [Bacteroidia bacterium]